MKKLFSRKRLSIAFSALGICLMGVDLMMTRNFFTHIGELMAASILCFVIGIVLDRQPKEVKDGDRRGKLPKQVKSS